MQADAGRVREVEREREREREKSEGVEERGRTHSAP
jgi:hypothetical protein